MYLSLSQPEFPAMTAKITLKPIEEPMKITTHYKKEHLMSAPQFLAICLVWLAFLGVIKLIYG